MSENLLKALMNSTGQDRTAWLNRQLAPAAGVMGKVLGPQGRETARRFGGLVDFSDAADYRDAVQFSDKTAKSVGEGDWWGAAQNAAQMGASAVSTVLPAVSGELLNQVAPTALGIFAGVGARTADAAKLSRAQELAEAGADRDSIWRETGWFTGADGKWRFEIDDSKADFGGRTSMGVTGAEVRYGDRDRMPNISLDHGRITERFRHPDVYSAYDFPQSYIPSLGKQGGKHVAPTYWEYDAPGVRAAAGDLRDAGRVEAAGLTPDGLRDTTIHEMQHHVQDLEGFARGGSVSDEAARIAAARDMAFVQAARRRVSDPADLTAIDRHNELANIWRNRDDVPPEIVEEVLAIRARPGVKAFHDDLREVQALRKAAGGGRGALESGTIGRDEAFANYNALAGEVEARNAATRRNFTPEQRAATPPWATQDVPDADQIVRRGGGKALSYSLDAMGRPQPPVAY